MTAITWAAQKRVPFLVRKRVMVECDYTCAYCGGRSTDWADSGPAGPDGLPWHVDHIRPADREDLTTLLPENLTLACATCNSLKGAIRVEALADELTRLNAHLSQMLAHAGNWPTRA